MKYRPFIPEKKKACIMSDIINRAEARQKIAEHILQE